MPANLLLEHVNLSRRRLLSFLPASGALVVAARWSSADEARKYGRDGMANGWRDDPKLFVSIAADGAVTIVATRAEMGQGVRTSLPMVLADELGADWARVSVVQAPGDEITWGNQDTDGSRSMRHWFMPMRRCGAALRTMLEMSAAAAWGVPLAQVRAEVHAVVHDASGRRLGFGELAAAAAKLPVPDMAQVSLKTPAQFRHIGKVDTTSGGVGNVDGEDIVRGRARYGADVQVDGMLYAAIARPPVLGGRVRSFDSAAALALPGVVKVIEIPGKSPPGQYFPLGGIAVLARNTWAATKGRDALTVMWDDGAHGQYDSAAFIGTLAAHAQAPGQVVRDAGDVANGLAAAQRRITADYVVPHMTHAPMEPPVATAQVTGERCEVWAPTQAPQALRSHIAGMLGIPEAGITIHVTLLGGGFGRKSKGDFAVEAAFLSKATGAPVRVQWTREDDIRHGYYHTVSAQHLEAGLDNAGKVTSWLHRTAAPTMLSIFMPDPKRESVVELGMGLLDLPFAIPNLRIETAEAEAHARLGWFRSVANIQHAFAIQSFVAEIAHAAQRDHRELLLELIGPARKIDPGSLGDHWHYGESPALYPIDTARWRRVIDRATAEAGWGRTLPAGHGLGLAAHHSFVSYTACVVEVHVDADAGPQVMRVDIAFDCGAAINPERVRSQLEGAVIMGIGNALAAEITFAEGRVQQGNFHDYPVLRIDAAPREIHVHLVHDGDYDAPLGGVGEPGLPPVAPALANALFAATGKRIRRLPVGEQWRA